MSIYKFNFLFFNLLFVLSVCFSLTTKATGAELVPVKEDIEVVFPRVLLTDLKTEIFVKLKSDNSIVSDYELEVFVNKKLKKLKLSDRKYSFEHIIKQSGEPLKVSINGFQYVSETKAIPLWMSVLPPLIAIFMALLFKEVFSSLFIGIFIGGGTIGIYTYGWQGIFTGLISIWVVFI